jgi:hypothetical protein
VGGGRVKEGDYGNGIWLMDFIHLYETELKNLLQLLLVGWGGGWGGETMGAMQIMYNISLIGIVTMNSPYNEYILIKNL